MDLLYLPMLWLGYCQSIQTSWHQSSDISGPCVTLVSSPSGLGGHVKVSPEYISFGGQYGYSIKVSESVSIVPSLGGGLGYSNTVYQGVRQITLFEFVATFEVHYREYGLRLGYTHASNGKGQVENNRGQDLLEMAVGLRF